MPPANGLSGTSRVRASAVDAAVGPAVTAIPVEASTLIDDSLGSGRSPKVIVTFGGGVESVAPAVGLEDCGSEWAPAGPARATSATRPRPAAGAPRQARDPDIHASPDQADGR